MELEMNLGFPWPPGIRETRRVREDERGNIGTRGGGVNMGKSGGLQDVAPLSSEIQALQTKKFYLFIFQITHQDQAKTYSSEYRFNNCNILSAARKIRKEKYVRKEFQKKRKIRRKQ